MAGFMVCYNAFFFRVEDERFLLEAANDALDRLLKVFNCNGLGRSTGSLKKLASIRRYMLAATYQ